MGTKVEGVQYLERNTARLITSNQVIVGPYNAVKELVENALDAESTSVEVRLDNFGLDKVEVKDNGRGIPKTEVPKMGLPGHSSKIKDFSDISSLSTYGFRGEALSALCCVANVAVTTKTKEDSVASWYKLDSEGNIVETKPSHLPQGTTISVSQLFCHQPARRRMLLSGKGGSSMGASKSATLNQVRTLLGGLSVAWPAIRFSLVHNGSVIWKKQAVPASSLSPLLVALGETIGHAQASNLKLLSTSIDSLGDIKLLVPKVGCKIKEICQSTKVCIMTIVNKRVIHHKKIESVVLEHIRKQWPDLGRSKFPTCVIDLTLNPQDLDVNLEPDKSKILINAEKEAIILKSLNKLLDEFYENSVKSVESIEEPCKKKPRVDDEESTRNIEDMDTDILKEEANSKRLRIEEVTINDEMPVIPSLNIEILGETVEEKLSTSESEETSTEHSEPSSTHNSQPTANSLLDSFDLSLLNESTSLDSSLDLAEDDHIAIAELEKLYCTNSDSNQQQSNTEVIIKKEVQNGFNDAWSRGYVATIDGKQIEACSVLAPPVLPLVKNSITYDNSSSPSSQMGCRELAGFSLYCRETRPQILLESPGMVFTDVAQILARRWKTLPTVEKERYGELSKELKIAKRFINNQRLITSPQVNKSPLTNSAKKFFTNNSKNVSNTNVSKKPSVTTISLFSKSDINKPVQNNPDTPVATGLVIKEVKSSDAKGKNASKKTSKPIKPKNEIQFTFNLEDIPLNKTSTDLDTSNEIVGKLQGCWLIKRGLELGLIRPWALRETLLYHRLMAELILPLVPLDTPLEITISQIGYKAWQALSQLQYQWDVLSNRTEICTPLVTSNGFRIVVNKSQDEQLNSAEITHITSAIPNYGLVELTELLLGLPCNIKESRPNSVKQYIQKKALDASNSINKESSSSSDIDDLLYEWDRLDLQDWHCLHDRDIYTCIHTMSEQQ